MSNGVRRFVIGIRDWSVNFVPFTSSAKDPIAETSHANQSFRVTLQPPVPVESICVHFAAVLTANSALRQSVGN